jgi:hypothetical protein
MVRGRAASGHPVGSPVAASPGVTVKFKTAQAGKFKTLGFELVKFAVFELCV